MGRQEVLREIRNKTTIIVLSKLPISHGVQHFPNVKILSNKISYHHPVHKALHKNMSKITITQYSMAVI